MHKKNHVLDRRGDLKVMDLCRVEVHYCPKAISYLLATGD